MPAWRYFISASLLPGNGLVDDGSPGYCMAAPAKSGVGISLPDNLSDGIMVFMPCVWSHLNGGPGGGVERRAGFH